MAEKATLDLYGSEYEALCWDTAIYMIKQEEAERHQQLIKAGTEIQDTVKEFLNGQKE